MANQNFAKDHGSQFTSPKWKKKLIDEDIKPVFCSIRHPQASIVERCNKEIKRFFRTLIKEKHGAWINYVKIVEKIMNEIYHETTEFKPKELHKNLKPERFWEEYLPYKKPNVPYEQKLFLAKDRIFKKRKHQNEKINKNRRLIEFSVGDLVLVKAAPISSAEDNTMKSLFHVYEGPYKVEKKINNTTYIISTLIDNTIKGQYHVDDLRRYFK